MQYLFLFLTFMCSVLIFPHLQTSSILATLLLADKFAGMVKNFIQASSELKKEQKKGEEKTSSNIKQEVKVDENLDHMIAGLARIFVIFVLIVPMALISAIYISILH